MNSNKLIITVLGAVIFILLNYLLLNEFLESQEDKLEEAILNGYQQGFQQALQILYDELNNCNISSITVENHSRFVMDASCVYDLES